MVRTIIPLIYLVTFFAYSSEPITFGISDTKKSIMKISAETLNSYHEDSFFKRFFPVTSQINFYHWKATEDENFIYLPGQTYFPDDPHCCPTDLLLKVDKKSHQLLSVEIPREKNKNYDYRSP